VDQLQRKSRVIDAKQRSIILRQASVPMSELTKRQDTVRLVIGAAV